MEKSGRSQGILEISVKVREFFKKEENSRNAPSIWKENNKWYNSENLLVVEIFPSPTETYTETLPASI